MGRITDNSVLQATGKIWVDWVSEIEAAEAQAASKAAWGHRDIVAYLKDVHGLSPWWCQSVANGFEQRTGRRELGETESAGYEVGVGRKLPLGVKAAWELLLSEKGIHIWLGVLADGGLEQGEAFTTTDGTIGQMRVRKDTHLRLTWKPKHLAKPSTVQLRVIAAKQPNSSTVSFHHEGLPGPDERQRMKTHWSEILSQLEAAGLDRS